MSSADPGPASPGAVSHGPPDPGRAEPRTLMRWIVGSSLRFRHIVVAAAVGMMALGITVLPKMYVDVFPEFASPRVLIQTACVGLSTSDVEQLVTVPIEVSLNGIQGLEDLRSKSVPQLSSIEVLFKPGTDLLRARQLVQERLATVSPSLPTWAAPPVMLAPVSATGRAMQRSEERRVGKECRSRGWPEHYEKTDRRQGC